MDRGDKDSNRAFYDSEREHDRHRFEEHPSKVFQAELLVPWIAARLAPGAAMLDIAGGSGAYASKLVRAADVSVAGLDISESMVRQRAEDPRLELNVVGDMEALPFADESFDAVLFVGCLHHVPDPLPALREAFRVLRPGGQLFAAEPVSLRAPADRAEQVPGTTHEFRISRRFLLGRIRAAGLHVDRVTGKRVAIRAIGLAVRSPGIGLYRKGDLLDRALGLVGLDRFCEMALVHGSRPGTPAGAGAAAGATRSLACPACHGPLERGGERLACAACGASYPVADGVPMLLAQTSPVG
jgi:SAM-dependent methyltransferase